MSIENGAEETMKSHQDYSVGSKNQLKTIPQRYLIYLFLDRIRISELSQAICLSASLSKSKNTVRKLLLLFDLNLFCSGHRKKFCFLPFLTSSIFEDRLNNPYLFNIFSQVTFSSFLIILLFSSGICPVGQNHSPVVMPQIREKPFPMWEE